MKRVGVIGTFVWDVIHGRDPSQATVEEWGGITYALAAFEASLPNDWEMVPLVKVGSDLAPRARSFLSRLSRVAALAGPIEVPQVNNRVEIRYLSSERRSEVLTGGVEPWSWLGLRPLLRGLDALYINLISGFELDLETCRLIRQHFSGPVYCDLHSVMLAIQPDGLRVMRPLESVPEWLRCFDIVQVNEDEMTMMAPDPMALAATALQSGVSSLLVTLASRGVVYINAPGFERLGDISRHAAVASLSGAVHTARVAPPAPRVKREDQDPTGCGDVFGATIFTRLLCGDTFADALHAAQRAAVRNLEFRGASGLVHHLRGEILPT